MDLLSLSPMESSVLTLVTVVVMFVAFLRESFPTEVVAIAGAAVLLALGVLPYDCLLYTSDAADE